jgi:hypothetical protein
MAMLAIRGFIMAFNKEERNVQLLTRQYHNDIPGRERGATLLGEMLEEPASEKDANDKADDENKPEA